MRIRVKKRFWFVVFLIAAIWIQNHYTFSSWSVCKKCGEKCSQTDFYIPFTNHIYWTLESERQTQLSRTAGRLGLVQSHSHD